MFSRQHDRTDLTQSTDSICALGQAATRRHTLPKLTHPAQCKSLCHISKVKGRLQCTDRPFLGTRSLFLSLSLCLRVTDIFSSIIDLLMNLTYLLIVLINSVESVSDRAR